MTADRIVRLIYMWVLREPRIKVQTQLSLSSETAVFWYGYCRDIACAITWHDFVPIGGPRDVVEVNESHVFRRKLNDGKATEWQHVWTLSGISRTTKKRFSVIIQNRDADTVLPILQQCIDGDSYICSDYSSAYSDCGIIFNGHGRVNQSTNFIHPPRKQAPMWMPAGRFHKECLSLEWTEDPPEPGLQPFRVHLQNIQRSWKDLKEHLRSLNNLEYASRYVGEWMYRKNILEAIPTVKGRFEKFLRDIGRVYPGVGRVAMRQQYEEILDCDCHECEPMKIE